MMEGDNAKQKKSKKQIYVLVDHDLKEADNETKEKDHIIDLERQPTMVHTPAENEGDKGKSILADKLNTMGFEGTSISMEVDNVMADAEDIIVDRGFN